MCGSLEGAQETAEPTFFMPLPSSTFPSGAKTTMIRSMQYVLMCRPVEEVMQGARQR
jgi:hypothetical protein